VLGVGEDFPVFVPAATYSKDGGEVTILLVEGYAFVASGLNDVQYFALERKAHVAQVLTAPGGRYKMRTPMTVPNAKIKEMRRQLQKETSVGVSVGDEVRVQHGHFRNLEGIVRGLYGDSASVQIRLRSLEVLAGIPRVFLEVVKTPHD
jgi:transcription antitermination factor NusG